MPWGTSTCRGRKARSTRPPLTLNVKACTCDRTALVPWHSAPFGHAAAPRYREWRLCVSVVAWILVAATGFPTIVAALFTAALVTAVASSAKAGAAERQALAQVRGVTREVEAAATATRALRAVAAARAGGVHAEPSAVATQAIAIVTSADLAPLAAPALTRRAAAERAAHAAAVEAAIQSAAEDSQNSCRRSRWLAPAHDACTGLRSQAGGAPAGRATHVRG